MINSCLSKDSCSTGFAKRDIVLSTKHSGEMYFIFQYVITVINYSADHVARQPSWRAGAGGLSGTIVVGSVWLGMGSFLGSHNWSLSLASVVPTHSYEQHHATHPNVAVFLAGHSRNGCNTTPHRASPTTVSGTLRMRGIVVQ